MYQQFFEDFEYTDAAGETCNIVLKSPPYEGVVVVIARQFGTVEDPTTHEIQIKFDYEVTDIPEGFDPEWLKLDAFVGLLRNIFSAILEKQLINAEEKIKEEEVSN